MIRWPYLRCFASSNNCLIFFRDTWNSPLSQGPHRASLATAQCCLCIMVNALLCSWRGKASFRSLPMGEGVSSSQGSDTPGS